MMGTVTYENELQPFYKFDAGCVVNELPEVVNMPRHVRKRPPRPDRQPQKNFFKRNRALARDPPFALILAERFCDEH
jgi:hypothetical protein